MDTFMLQDEGVRDRIRQAEDFLDPSTNASYHIQASQKPIKLNSSF